MLDKKKPKKRTLSKRTKSVNKAAKKVGKLIKKGKAGSANAAGGGLTKAPTGGRASSLTASIPPSKNPKFGGDLPGSFGNLVKKKKRKAR